MNAQEALNKNWQHFIVERNEPGADEEGNCRLRTAGDNKACGVGILIREEDYEPELEYLSMRELENELSYLPGNRAEGFVYRTFLGGLQEAHDNAVGPHFRDTYKRSLRELAERFDLEVPEND